MVETTWNGLDCRENKQSGGRHVGDILVTKFFKFAGATSRLPICGGGHVNVELQTPKSDFVPHTLSTTLEALAGVPLAV
jgi:hypothetical protein